MIIRLDTISFLIIYNSTDEHIFRISKAKLFRIYIFQIVVQELVI